MHEEGGDPHYIIDDSDSDEGNIDEDGDYIGMFNLAANAADLDLRYEKIVMAVVTLVMMMLKNTQTRAIIMKRNFTLLDLNFLGASDDEITEHNAGSEGALAQLINMKQETRKSVWMSKDKAYLSGWLWCAVMLETSLFAFGQ